jgi:signal transduction histidine kinase
LFPVIVLVMVGKSSWLSREPDRPHLSALGWLLILAVICVVVLTGLMRYEINYRVNEESVDALTADANNAANNIDSQVQSYAEDLEGFRGLFISSSVPPSQSVLTNYYNSLQNNWPANQLKSVSFLSTTSTASSNKFAMYWAINGASNYANQSSIAANLSALDKARDSGQLIATKPQSPLDGFSLLLPIYEYGGSPSTTSARRAELEGLMKADIPYNTLFANTLGASSNTDLTYLVKDSSSSNAFLYAQPAQESTGLDPLTITIPLLVAGRTWQLTVVGNRNFAVTSADQTLSAAITVFGASIVLLLLIVLYMQLQNRRERLLEQTKDEFVSLVSHQLRAPITSIRLFMEMLLDEQVGRVNKKQRSYLDNVQASTLRMTVLINEFLNISRLELGQLEVRTQKMHLEDVVEGIIKQLMPLAEKGKLKVSFDKPTLSEVEVEPTLYGQVVNNLLSNAINYTLPGGKINLKLSETPDGYLLDVADSGIGIPDEAKTKLFRRFYRADNAKRATSDGSGLGLYLVKKIVDMFGGKVWYESGVNSGTIFHVIIPLSGMTPKKKRP